MPDFDMYTDETCEEAIKSFQERLVEADNLKKDSNGMMNYETCWKAMRKEGPMILNVAKHLYSMHITRHHRVDPNIQRLWNAIDKVEEMESNG